MNTISIFVLKVLRKLYSKTFGNYKIPTLQREENPDKVSEMIYNLLSLDKPCMIARFGSTELSAIVNYLGVNSKKHSVIKFMKGEQPEWWWNKNIMKQMQEWSGFFPPTTENMQRFGKMMLEDAKEVDILGSWLNKEKFLDKYLIQAQKVQLIYLDPFWSTLPWSRILEDKKVLIIHPFAETIKLQYSKREYLFRKGNVLPKFKSMQIIKAVQSLGGANNGFKDWFSALGYMKHEIERCDFDICLIGCGAYGFPLAAHVKRMGKKAVHMGGSLQLLFGIIGKRWESPDYGSMELNKKGCYPQLINEYWIRPEVSDRPQNAKYIEGGCYW